LNDVTTEKEEDHGRQAIGKNNHEVVLLEPGAVVSGHLKKI
jgi:hypothetical protein